MGSSQTRAQTLVPCIGRWILNHCATKEVPLFLINLKKQYFFSYGLCFVSRETKEGGRIIVEVDGKVAKIRNLKVSLKLFSFFFPLRS